jgi:hypothetical protein
VEKKNKNSLVRFFSCAFQVVCAAWDNGACTASAIKKYLSACVQREKSVLLCTPGMHSARRTTPSSTCINALVTKDQLRKAPRAHKHIFCSTSTMLCVCDGGLAAAAEIDFQPHEWNLGLCLAPFPVFASEMRSLAACSIWRTTMSIFLADSAGMPTHQIVLFG